MSRASSTSRVRLLVAAAKGWCALVRRVSALRPPGGRPFAAQHTKSSERLRISIVTGGAERRMRASRSATTIGAASTPPKQGWPVQLISDAIARRLGAYLPSSPGTAQRVALRSMRRPGRRRPRPTESCRSQPGAVPRRGRRAPQALTVPPRSVRGPSHGSEMRRSARCSRRCLWDATDIPQNTATLRG